MIKIWFTFHDRNLMLYDVGMKKCTNNQDLSMDFHSILDSHSLDIHSLPFYKDEYTYESWSFDDDAHKLFKVSKSIRPWVQYQTYTVAVDHEGHDLKAWVWMAVEGGASPWPLQRPNCYRWKLQSKTDRKQSVGFENEWVRLIGELLSWKNIFSEKNISLMKNVPLMRIFLS